MAQKMDLELRAAWRQRIERQRESGLTVAEFCRRERVPQGSFYLWKRKLQSKSGSKSRRPAKRQPAARAVRSQPQAPSEAGFVQLPLSSTRTSPWIELVLVEGTVIRLPQQNVAPRGAGAQPGPLVVVETLRLSKPANTCCTSIESSGSRMLASATDDTKQSDNPASIAPETSNRVSRDERFISRPGPFVAACLSA